MFVNCKVANPMWTKYVKMLDVRVPLFRNILELMGCVELIKLSPLKMNVFEVSL